jgi:maleamate amidohydrolase
LPRRDSDLVVSKQHGSAFFGTELAPQLSERGIDTLLICGCVTSGCVRASAVDAAQHGFRPLVVREAVGDRSPLANEANLIDIDQRYGDVVTLKEALDYLARVSKG